MMRVIANKFVSGESPEQIAKATSIGLELVLKYLNEAVRVLHCEPMSWAGAYRDNYAEKREQPTTTESRII